jgi:hypothetical protein
MRSVWFLLAACGCRSILGIEAPVESSDSPMIDAPALCSLWHPASLDPCTLGAPSPALSLAAGTYTYDTTEAGGALTDASGRTVIRSSLTLPQDDGPALAVLSVDALDVAAGATIQVVGVKPLLIVAWSTVVVDGALDASSHLGVVDGEAHIAQTVRFGAGANGGCGDPSVGKDGTGATDAGLGSGGGGGGALQGSGGAASPGGAADVMGGSGGIGAPAAALHGGCHGGLSGIAGRRFSMVKDLRSQGGAGGGALRIIAHDSIAVAGSISANGAGGAGAPTASGCGGGGGGSGGALALEAPIVMLGGTLTANGGSGGGGGNETEPGHDGADGRTDGTAAPGGAVAANGCGAAGGAGSAGDPLVGESATLPDACGADVDGGGGGGGGGGAGFIRITSPGLTTAESARISPPLAQR